MTQPMITVANVTFGYDPAKPIFERFSWHVEDGESWAVIGPSGCGKSTLLYLLAGLRRPQSGKVVIGGKPVTRPRPETGLILQDYGLLPWATVWENAALGLNIRRFYGPDGKHSPRSYRISDPDARVRLWLERLGLIEHKDKFPAQLSGGQRQRTAIARTLALEPDLLLMDEPFSSLDALTRESLQDLIVTLRAETGVVTVIVTHNIEEAVFLGQKILVLGAPPNREPSVVVNPGAGTRDYRSSREFLGKCTYLRKLLGGALEIPR